MPSALPTWFHKWGSPRYFFQLSGTLLPWLWAIALICLIGGVIWGLAYAPIDAKQGNSYRIIYLHVPIAAVAMAGYLLMAMAAVIVLVWRMKLAEMVMKSAAPIGAVFTLIALITGSIWGKPTWGTWWVWDARVVSVLVLFFLYVGVIALYEAFDNKQAALRACAVLAIVGAVNIPIIYWSVDWWYALHQGATIKLTGESSIHPSMAYPLIATFIGVYALYGALLLGYTRTEVMEREASSRWLRELYDTPSKGQR